MDEKELDPVTGKPVEKADASATPPAAAAKPGWREMLGKRKPDLDTSDDEQIGNYLGESFADYDKMKDSQNRFNEMLGSDERAAGILSGLATGQNENGEPFSLDEYMANNYLEDWVSGMTVEDIAKKAKEMEAKRIKENAERAAKKKKDEERISTNYTNSNAALTEAAKEANVDEALLGDMLAWLYGTKDQPGAADRAAALELNKEDWMRLIHAFNREGDAEAARQEGARSSRTRRPSHRDLTDLPTDTGAGGGGEMSRGSGNPVADYYGKMKRKYS
jgi:hypothetical protein